MTAHETTPSDAAIGQAFLRLFPDTDRPDSYYKLVTNLAREIEQGRGALPELPEPSFKLKWVGDAYKVNQPSIGNTECYTAAQMKAYGEACRRMGNRDE